VSDAAAEGGKPPAGGAGKAPTAATSGAHESAAASHGPVVTAARTLPSVRVVLPWLAPLTLLCVWEASSRLGLVSSTSLPAPSQVLAAAVRSASHGGLWGHLGASALRALAGLLIGGTLGLVLGLASGLSRTLQLVLDGPLQMLRAIPALALVPLVILWFGLGEGAKLFIVAITVLFPVYLNTFHGVRSVDPQLLEMARVYKIRGLTFYREIILPGALPSILVGLRYALGLSWLVLIVAETLGAQRGLGYVAMTAREFMQMDMLVLTIVLWAALGKLADVFARRLERWLLPWQPASQRMGVE
jgi:sulfonate transport system permease protein